jgi:Kef-type K+ transport system membrane component KefB
MGQAMISLICIQVVLGIMALAVTQGRATVGAPTTLEVTITTAHQATGAILLALAVALHFWTQRLFRPANASPEGATDG